MVTFTSVPTYEERTRKFKEIEELKFMKTFFLCLNRKNRKFYEGISSMMSFDKSIILQYGPFLSKFYLSKVYMRCFLGLQGVITKETLIQFSRNFWFQEI